MITCIRPAQSCITNVLDRDARHVQVLFACPASFSIISSMESWS